MDGASFSPCLAKVDKGDHHLDAPYYLLCLITWCDEDLWDETLMIIRPCHQLLKAKNDKVVGG
jgi:hypothetical protein